MRSVRPSSFPTLPTPALVARAAVASAFLFALAVPRDASADPIPLVPQLNCVVQDPQTKIATAYFGYTNTGTSSLQVLVGPDNEIVPGLPFNGQPSLFNVGNYPRVFAVSFDPTIVSVVVWSLNGIQVEASTASPPCVSSVTAPATGATATSASLNGVVLPDGVDTTYYFEYGPTPAFGQTTPVVDAGSSTSPALVQAAVAGLAPNTAYYFRLDTVGEFGLTSGQPQTFTTAANPPPPPSGPSVTRVTAVSLPLGDDLTLVKIEGTGLALAASAGTSWPQSDATVHFGTKEAELVLWDSSTSILVVPPRGHGTVAVTVTVAGVTSAIGPADAFTYPKRED
jgi:hypothetical protein